MNCPSRTDETLDHPGWNQNPSPLSPDITTRSDFNGITNARERRSSLGGGVIAEDNSSVIRVISLHREDADDRYPEKEPVDEVVPAAAESSSNGSPPRRLLKALTAPFHKDNVQTIWWTIAKYFRFVGPGFLISVAYIDPGNYAADVSAGAEYRYRLLFVVLLSNLFAIFFQSLCVKLGSVTGLNLAENCREHLPRWMVIILYVFAEAAIVATDISEVSKQASFFFFFFFFLQLLGVAKNEKVIGSAISLNLLGNVPLVAGCVITLVDTLFLLILYRPDGTMWGLRAFESFVACLVVGVVICFCIQLSLIKDQSVGHVFQGYLPSKYVVQSDGFVSPSVNE